MYCKVFEKEDSFVKSFHLNLCEYSTINFIPQKLWDIYCFCILDGHIFCRDTTFEICNGLYFTDTIYLNLSLHDINSQHPEFLGPSLWHFKRTREAYCCFAGETLMGVP